MSELFTEVTHWTWWILAVGFVLVEVVVPGTFFLWMGVSAAIVGVVLFLSPGVIWEIQLVIFAVVSLLSIFLSRKYLVSGSDEMSTLNYRGKRYVGQEFPVEEPILNGYGKVRIEDTLWRVHGPDTSKGRMVRVVGVEGATLQVEAV